MLPKTLAYCMSPYVLPSQNITRLYKEHIEIKSENALLNREKDIIEHNNMVELTARKLTA